MVPLFAFQQQFITAGPPFNPFMSIVVGADFGAVV